MMQKKTKNALRSATALLALALSGNASASLLGHWVLWEFRAPTIDSLLGRTEFQVGPGTELPDSGFLEVDLSASNIKVTYTTTAVFDPVPFLGNVGTDRDGAIPDIINVSINPETTVQGFDTSRVSFTADSVTVNMQGLAVTQGEILSLDLTFAQPVPVGSPVALAMLAGGLGFVAMRRRRRLM